MTNSEVSLMNKRIAAVFNVLTYAENDWSKQYLNNVLAYLMRQANRCPGWIVPVFSTVVAV